MNVETAPSRENFNSIRSRTYDSRNPNLPLFPIILLAPTANFSHSTFSLPSWPVLLLDVDFSEWLAVPLPTFAWINLSLIKLTLISNLLLMGHHNIFLVTYKPYISLPLRIIFNEILKKMLQEWLIIHILKSADSTLTVSYRSIPLLSCFKILWRDVNN